MKIIIHIDEIEKWPMVLSNLAHLNEHYANSDDVIELLVNGPAVVALQTSRARSASIQSALQPPNQLAVCQNSLDQRQINLGSLISAAKIVPSGVVELVEKQSAGYAYLRP
ncbi:DsrE family protein [Pediococcus acidilactici]|uniref:DsrE family protein n=1 Tax=Pediococcus acidilactici TaxID=1254 RepID=UPI000E5D5B1A|nr:DsrE family protein [Pediococcus acidilactici]KAF0368916.1 hypothetical protein GBO52_01585 [Pediococcus acidilactici]RJF51005.1 hypothetical protein DSN65_04465 [Pediococcus acidilactici]